MKPFEAKIRVDGATWFDDTTSCVLVGNVGNLFGGVEAFDDARPDDGMLELGVVTAESALECRSNHFPRLSQTAYVADLLTNLASALTKQTSS